MSELNAITEEIMTEEQASAILHESFFVFSEDTSAEHDMLVDATQFLALGGITLDQVAGTAVSLAKEQNSYGIGRVFDVFTTEALKYGKHVVAVTKGITPSATVVPSMTYGGKYLKSRLQFMINSELKKDHNGHEYFEIMRRGFLVSSNTATAWSAYDRKNGARRTMKLYVKDLEGQKFYTMRDGVKTSVALGDTSVFDAVQDAIHASGAVSNYVQTLNAMPQNEVEMLSDNQQALFYTVFKAIKGEVTSTAKAPATAEEKAYL